MAGLPPLSGRHISARRNQLGITTALKLANSNVSMMRMNFNVIVERIARELNGESSLALENVTPPPQQIVNFRSFEERINQLEHMQRTVIMYA